MHGHGGLSSYLPTMDMQAPTASFLRVSHITATPWLPELGRAPGNLFSQRKVLEGAWAFILHFSGPAEGRTAQKPKCQGHSSEPAFTFQVDELLGTSPAPSGRHAYYTHTPVLSMAFSNGSSYITEHLLCSLDTWVYSTHKSDQYL